MKRTDEFARFWGKVDKSGGPDSCWIWLAGKKCGNLYGKFYLDGKTVGAHKVAWTFANGQQVPDGMFVCHSCDNPQCVNPAHLWVGTASDNIRDAYAKNRKTPPARNRGITHCIRGHEFTDANTIRAASGRRHCRTCKNDHNREYMRNWWRSRGKSRSLSANPTGEKAA